MSLVPKSHSSLTTLLVAPLAVAALALAQSNAGPKTKDPIPATGDAVPELEPFDDLMRKFMSERDIQAGTLAITKGGKLVFARGYGHIDRQHTEMTAPATPMRIASISKPITLAALTHLVRAGKVTLKTKAFVYLGSKPPPGRDMDKRLLDITIKDLIDHKGGWDRDKTDDPMFMSLKIADALGKPGPPTADDIITYMAGQPLQHDPGTKTNYSNFGYCVLGRVIEKASGKKYIDYVHEVVTDPLKLKSVQLARTLPKDRDPKEPIYLDPDKDRNIMQPASKKHVPAPDGTFCLEAMDANGGLIASAPDLAKFLTAYWLSGEPRQPGQLARYSFFGNLPGTFAVVIQRPDGTNIAALFNQRTDPSKLSYEDIRESLNKTANGIKVWLK